MLSTELKRLADAYRVDPKTGLKPIVGRVVGIRNDDVILGDINDLGNRVWQAPATSYITGVDEAARYSPITLEQAMSKSYAGRQRLIEQMQEDSNSPTE